MKKGKLIVLEGIDGCGKTTQSVELFKYLVSLGKKVTITAEPSNSEIGKLIRKIQKGECVKDPSIETMMFLYAADRTEHVKMINDLLKKGEYVICDRYVFSSCAYQGIRGNLNRAMEVNSHFPLPDLTLWFDISPEVAHERVSRRDKKEEIFENLSNLKEARALYSQAFQYFFKTDDECDINGYSFHRIDANGTVEEVFDKVTDALYKSKLV